MTSKALLPKDKFDFQATEILKELSFEEIQAIVPNLLEWLQDGNWPISKSVAAVLIPFTDQIATEIVKILKSNDETWKYWILLTFGKNTNNRFICDEIIRIVQNPSQEEIDANVYEIAKEILEQIKPQSP